MSQHHRRFGGHEHGGKRHTPVADTDRTISLPEASPAAVDSGQ